MESQQPSGFFENTFLSECSFGTETAAAEIDQKSSRSFLSTPSVTSLVPSRGCGDYPKVALTWTNTSVYSSINRRAAGDWFVPI